ncbi:glycoside hydrolase family 15 protein [Actinomadura hibisca]|uniref:glycoside hydrolase family 15 protein n=1 Tax=Actinomadura hibisca TaxID=68565 RepID=UPI000829A2FD|nr:glycoside hydrolase family 15 protein [Actinomadura hibisca]
MTPPIGSYGFLSDCRTAALTGPDGAVEWWCAPRFDAAAVFNRILDRDVGGSWEIEVADAGEPERAYTGNTLVLESRWKNGSATLVARDFLAAGPAGEDDDRGIVPRGALVRLLRCERGEATVRSRVRARPDHARHAPRWREDGQAVVEEEAGLRLTATVPPRIDGDDVVITTTLQAGQTLVMVLGYTDERFEPDQGEKLLEQTLLAWDRWSDRYVYDGYGAEHVRFSAVVLRGLMHSESGGLIAAPTTSLPEWPGGERNWDYRYVWHRDAALMVLVLLRLGHDQEAGKYLRFLLDNCALEGDRLKPMLTLDGGTHVAEESLDHLAGYDDSRPVRIGNKAFEQFQIDVYGQVLDAALVFQQATGKLSPDHRAGLYEIVEAAARVWQEPDDGIWEVRDAQRHWTSSKVYAWVCLDRGIRMAELCGDDAPLERWRTERTRVHQEVLDRGYDEGADAFVQSYGAGNLDASLLRLPLLNFLPGTDPRVLATLKRVDEWLSSDGLLIHRYDPEQTNDGVNGPEGAFLMCSFDMASALVLAERPEEARRRFEELCERGGPLGLFSEEMDEDGVMLGNYPQAFTHLALIEAAMNLDVSGDKEALHSWAERNPSG